MIACGKSQTRVDLYDAVYRKVGLSRAESTSFVELVLKEITDCIARGTGIDAPIPPRRVVLFNASAILKQQIKGSRRRSQSPDAEAHIE